MRFTERNVLRVVYKYRKSLFPGRCLFPGYFVGIVGFCSNARFYRKGKAGETHVYTRRLKAGRFFDAAVNQRGINIEVNGFLRRRI